MVHSTPNIFLFAPFIRLERVTSFFVSPPMGIYTPIMVAYAGWWLPRVERLMIDDPRLTIVGELEKRPRQFPPSCYTLSCLFSCQISFWLSFFAPHDAPHDDRPPTHGRGDYGCPQKTFEDCRIPGVAPCGSQVRLREVIAGRSLSSPPLRLYWFNQIPTPSGSSFKLDRTMTGVSVNLQVAFS
ncbi:hypothetical protein B0H12DRAFT_430278 [Mycena haematopus]|nr:hypothetical protein B0H12DRAFT_430278 [Mycena haematopus]